MTADEFGAAIDRLIADARRQGLSDEAMLEALEVAAERLVAGLGGG
jgi:hypothetical protein